MWIDDQVLEQHTNKLCCNLFVPKSCEVILGSGNDENSEVNMAHCNLDGVPVLRRYGGGGTVVLYPGTVVVSIGCWVKELYQNNFYFKSLNQSVISCLSKRFSSLIKLEQAGISDIVFENKKVAGTSMFRSRNYLLYQASILIDLEMKLMDRYLRHPSREPDYRKGRTHRDFLTGLNELLGTKMEPKVYCQTISEQIESRIHLILGDHLVEPIPAQFSALEQRLKRQNL